MKNRWLILSIGVLTLLSGCSSLTFIPTPPAATLATTDYVNKQMATVAEKTTQELLEKTRNILDESLAAERARLDELKSAMESQQKDIASSMEFIKQSKQEIDQTVTTIQDIVAKERKKVDLFKREVADSLDNLWNGINQLQTTDQKLQENIALLEANINKLERANEQLRQDIAQINVRLEGMPKETMLALRKAIENFYQLQSGN